MSGTTDTVKAMLTPGEFVIRKEAVDMIGVPILEKLNDMPEAGGHSEIDRLIAQATLKNMTGMYGGGMVNAKQYMGGGMVNEYKHGGKVHKNLKPIPKDNPGLAKLPEKVRNKMGYMQEGGEVEDSLMGMMYGGMAKKKKKYGYQDGGEILGLNITPESVFQAVYQMPTDDGDRYYLGEAQRPLPNLSRKLSIKRAMDKAMNAPQDSITFDMAQQILNPEEEKGGFLKKLLGMQEGGAVQDSSMMMQPSPFIPFDQRPNQSPASGYWGEPGAYYNALKDSLEAEREELVADTARNALDSLKLDSLIRQISGDAMRIERSPSEPFFFPNTEVQENFMQKYKEEMIDPTYFPEGN
tara:strand:+ start:127 stop:1185 length:1059 start_codon:yes stop_codon:yes gene_type:complete